MGFALGKIAGMIKSRRDSILLSLIIGVIFILLLPRIDNSPPTPDDAAAYISLGSSIITGQGYQVTHVSEGHPHTKFPFVFPLLLGAVMHVWGYNYYAMRLLQVLLFLFSLVALYELIKRKTDTFTAYSIVLLTAMSVFVVQYVFFIYSETAYRLFSILSLIFVERYASAKKTFSPLLIPAAFFVACTFFTRTAGLTVVFAACAYLFFEAKVPERRAASLQKFFVMSAITILCVCLWFLRAYVIHKTFRAGYIYTGGLSKYGLFHSGIIRNVYGMIFCGFPSLISSIKIEHRSVLGFILSFIMLWGFAEKYAKKRTIIEYYFGAYLCLLVYWYDTFYSKRLQVPIAPFIFYYFIAGISSLMDRCSTLPLLRRVVQFKKIIIALVLLHAVFKLKTFLYG